MELVKKLSVEIPSGAIKINHRSYILKPNYPVQAFFNIRRGFGCRRRGAYKARIKILRIRFQIRHTRKDIWVCRM